MLGKANEDREEGTFGNSVELGKYANIRNSTRRTRELADLESAVSEPRRIVNTFTCEGDNVQALLKSLTPCEGKIPLCLSVPSSGISGPCHGVTLQLEMSF